jgi:FkbM family methyltransferase
MLAQGYWTAYQRYLRRVDQRFLKGTLMRISTPRDIERRATPIRIGVGRGLLWQHRDGYSHGFWIGYYDHEMQEAMRRYVTRGTVFFDIGANAGFHALLAARLVGPTGHVYSFEPLPNNVEMVAEQLRLNQVDWCDVVEKAVSETDGECDIFLGTTNAVASLMDKGERSVRVETIMLDTFCDGERDPDVVKLDIEGAEGMALRGGVRTVERAKPVFLIEFHGPECVREVDDVLRPLGYEYRTFSGRRLDVGAVPPRGQVLAIPS